MEIEPTAAPCTRYTYDYDSGDEGWYPCQCPVCHAFLGDINKVPLICKRCGSELALLETTEAQKESDDYEGEEGKICVLEKRQNFKKPKRKSDSYSYQI